MIKLMRAVTNPQPGVAVKGRPSTLLKVVSGPHQPDSTAYAFMADNSDITSIHNIHADKPVNQADFLGWERALLYNGDGISTRVAQITNLYGGLRNHFLGLGISRVTPGTVHQTLVQSGNRCKVPVL